MTTEETTKLQPLWLAMEEKIRGLGDSDLGAGSAEGALKGIVAALDDAGYNVSRHAGNMLQLRAAVAARVDVGRPLLHDFCNATEALTLEDVADPLRATVALANDIGEVWPKLRGADRRADILEVVEGIKLDLLVAKAKTLADDQGIRYLIGEEVVSQTIMESLEVSEEKLAEVHAAIEAERAAIARVEQLLEEVAGQPDEARARHLITNDVAEELIVEHAKIEPAVLVSVQQAMEAEIAEKQRLAEEEAARKKAAAEGPSLSDIPPDELVDFIEEVQEILEFTEVEKEIRQMCEASSIPKALVDLAVSDPDKLEALAEEAEG